MKELIVSIKLLGFLILTYGVYFGRIVTHPLAILSPRVNRTFRGFFFRRWARGLATLLGLRIQVEGLPPKAPYLLVTNHLGYIDIVTLATQINAVFVSRHDLAEWPIIGRVTKVFDTLFINREQLMDIPKVLRQMDEKLNIGEGLVVFPEGTSSNGADILPLKTALLALPARRDMPVYCATIHYETPAGCRPAGHSVCWWGEMEFIPHLKGMFRLPRIDATLTFQPDPVQHADRRVLAATVDKQLRATHKPIRQADEKESA